MGIRGVARFVGVRVE